MSYSDRIDFQANDAVERAMQGLDDLWRDATRAVTTIGANPYDSLIAGATAAADFPRSVVEEAWDGIRNVYEPAAMVFNQIRRITATPCEDSWTVLIDTALPAAGEALWILLVPSPKEVLEEYLSPKGLRGDGRNGRDARGTRRGPSESDRRRRFWPRIPDIDGLIGDNLPGSQAVQGRDVGLGQKWLFKGIDIADRISWNFMLLDIGHDFFTLWSSGIMEARFCTRPWDHLGYVTVEPTSVGTPSFAQLQGGWDHDEKNCHIAAPNSFELLTPGGNPTNATGTIVGSRSWTYTHLGDQGIDPYHFRWRVRARAVNGIEENYYGDWKAVGLGDEVAFPFSADFTVGSQITLFLERQESNFQGTSFQASAGSYQLFAENL